MSIPIPEWTPPWSTSSTPTFVRISSTHLRPTGCPEQVARKARPDLWPDDRPPWQPTAVGSFPLGLARDAILILLTQPATSADPAERVAHAIVQAVEQSWDDWDPDSLPAVEQAVVGYLEVLESLRIDGALPDTRAFADLVVTEGTDDAPVELWAWAVFHVGLDGRVREAHLLRWRNAASVPLSPAEVAHIAHVTGSGVIAEHDKWWKAFRPSTAVTQPPPAQTVRVRVIGMLDGSTDIRFDGTATQAAQEFAELVPGSLDLLSGGSTRPSAACAGCSIRHVCPGLPRLPGVLGVAGYSPRTRAISPSALWTHRACPRQLHLARDLGLPRTSGESSPSLVRGMQVHEWLATAHARGVACGTDDLPADADQPGLHADLGWSDEDYATNRPYLLQHVGQCPFDESGTTDLDTEVAVTVWDTDANVILSTRPDTAYRGHDGRWVLRETKTLSPQGLPDDRTLLLERYTQVAAAVCLLADGWAPGGSDERPGRVELELLGPEEGLVLSFDAADPVVVLVARTALADRVDAWLFDVAHPVGAHPPCRTCEVFEWCDLSPASAVEEITAELLPAVVEPAAAWAGETTDEALRTLAAPDDDEEFPF